MNSLLSILAFLLIFTENLYTAEQSNLFWPPPPADMRITFVKSITSPSDIGIRPSIFKKITNFISGERKEFLYRPVAVAVDQAKTIYVCDPGASAVHIFNPKDRRYKKITSINGQALISPVGVAVDTQGRVFISDSKLNKVFCLNKNGRLAYVLGEDNSLKRPTGLAVYKDRLYLVDTVAQNIRIYDLSGHFIKTFGQRGKGAGEFNYPTSITLDKEGKIYVVDTLNFRIQVFDQENQFLFSIGHPGDGSGSFSRPKGVAVDSLGHIYTTDGLFDNLQIFGQDGKFLLSLGESGHNDGEFWIVSGIAIDEDNDIYLADSYNQRLQVLHYIGKD